MTTTAPTEQAPRQLSLPMYGGPQEIVTDIMGTIVPYTFVDKLYEQFSASGERIFKENSVARTLADCIKGEKSFGLGSDADVVKYVNQETRARRFRPEFMTLSGIVNLEGYKSGELQTLICDDVPGAFKEWQANDLKISTFSQGSSPLQAAMLRYTTHGDLRSFVSNYFDTSIIGAKDNPDSYTTICGRHLNRGVNGVIFFSDANKELDAAHKAGLTVVRLNRDDGHPPQESRDYQTITSFNGFKF